MCHVRIQRVCVDIGRSGTGIPWRCKTFCPHAALFATHPRSTKILSPSSPLTPLGSLGPWDPSPQLVPSFSDPFFSLLDAEVQCCLKCLSSFLARHLPEGGNLSSRARRCQLQVLDWRRASFMDCANAAMQHPFLKREGQLILCLMLIPTTCVNCSAFCCES